MSYILEALKKSQQERDLGLVPRLDNDVFEAEPEPAGSRPWSAAALVLAVIAVVIASYAVLHQRAVEPPEPTEAAVPVPKPESTPPVSSPSAQGSESAATEPPPISTEGPSVEPRVLVVPAPPKPGAPLPRGADELRRAVLGPNLTPSIQSRDPRYPEVPLPPPGPAERGPGALANPEPEQPVIPDDLRADIEAFKREVRTGDSAGPAAQEPAPAATLPQVPPVSPKEESDATLLSGYRGLKPSPATRAKLPAYTMPVHVYDSDPARRFVYINGRKIAEQEESREGIRVDRIVPDGAILSFQGERFFQRR